MNSPVIGGLNEKSLHRQLKEQYCTGESLVEEKVSGYVVDVVNPDELVEIQTSNFSGMRKKLKALLPEHRIRVVYPVSAEKMITVYNKDGSQRSRRRSPKRESIISAAAELLYIAELLPEPNLTVEILLVRQEEIRYDDGKGSWRRRGVSIEDRLLAEIIDRSEFNSPADYLSLLPEELPSPFGNRELAEQLPKTGTGSRGRIKLAGQLTYFLRKLGLLEITGKEGNRLLFDISR